MSAREIPPENTSMVNDFALTAPKNEKLDVSIFIISPGSRKQDCLSARQDLRPAIDFALFMLKLEQGWRAAVGGNARESEDDVQGSDDVAVLTPASRRVKHGCTPGRVRIAFTQSDGSAALERYLLELAFGKESDPLSIRRKEGRSAISGARQR